MTLDQLIALASKHYPDGVVENYHKEPDKPHGDLLAMFVASELKETFDTTAEDDDQICEAERVIERAIDDLINVHRGLRSYFDQPKVVT